MKRLILSVLSILLFPSVSVAINANEDILGEWDLSHVFYDVEYWHHMNLTTTVMRQGTEVYIGTIQDGVKVGNSTNSGFVDNNGVSDLYPIECINVGDFTTANAGGSLNPSGFQNALVTHTCSVKKIDRYESYALKVEGDQIPLVNHGSGGIGGDLQLSIDDLLAEKPGYGYRTSKAATIQKEVMQPEYSADKRTLLLPAVEYFGGYYEVLLEDTGDLKFAIVSTRELVVSEINDRQVSNYDEKTGGLEAEGIKVGQDFYNVSLTEEDGLFVAGSYEKTSP